MAVLEKDEDQINLAPGFRFHPTDEELITHYLSKKVHDSRFCAIAVGEADLNKSEPWELPRIAKIGEKEWYFFVLRDKKYPTGLRTNRATNAGYWKATGKDKEIYKKKCLVGMKKTLVFYTGRAPTGVKSNWVMHEYRLDETNSLQNLPQSANTEWVVCRVFQKNLDGKKVHMSGTMKNDSFNNETSPLGLPALMDSSPSNEKLGHVTSESMCMPCFSNPINVQSNQEDIINRFNSSVFSVSSNPCDNLNGSNFYYSGNQVAQIPVKGVENTSYFMMEDHETNSSNLRGPFKTERGMASVSHETKLTTDTRNIEISSVISNFGMGRRSFDYQEDPSSSSSSAPFDIDGFWS